MIFMIIFGVALLVAIAVGGWYLLVGRALCLDRRRLCCRHNGANHAAHRRHHRQRPDP